MRLLDAVNIILPLRGEPQVTSLNDQNPTVDIITDWLEFYRKQLLSDSVGWWFQRSRVTVHKDLNDGRYKVSSNVLAFIPDPPVHGVLISGYLHPLEGYPDFDGKPIQGKAVLDMPFEDLPDVAQQYVVMSAAGDVLNQVGIDPERVTRLAAAAYAQLTTLHTNTVQVCRPQPEMRIFMHDA